MQRAKVEIKFFVSDIDISPYSRYHIISPPNNYEHAERFIIGLY